VTSPDLATAGVTPVSSASRPPDVSLKHNANLLALPIHQTSHLRLLLTQFPTIYLIEVRRCLYICLSGISPSYLLITSTTAPSASQEIISASDPGADPQDDGSSMSGLREAKGMLYPSSGASYANVQIHYEHARFTIPVTSTGLWLGPSHRRSFTEGIKFRRYRRSSSSFS
jgi:hypothetical protein